MFPDGADGQKTRQSNELGGLGKKFREVDLFFRRRRGEARHVDGSGHEGLAEFYFMHVRARFLSARLSFLYCEVLLFCDFVNRMLTSHQ